MRFEDHHWTQLRGAYKTLYDPRSALRKLASGKEEESAWHELWNELHHQGDVGEASYVVIPVLTDLYHIKWRPDWNLFALAATIEVERHRKTNPPLPEWLRVDYEKAWQWLAELAVKAMSPETEADTEMVQSALAVLAIAKGALKLGALIINLDSSELDEILDEHVAWRELYSEAG